MPEAVTFSWNFTLPAFIVGFLFGAALFLGGLADPDKIIGALRLKDLHAMRTILLFVLVGMLGVWVLGLLGYAHLSIKPATMATIIIGGALLGVGFGMTGYCPGTGLACAAAGRFDALITVLGMFAGSAVFILIHPTIVVPLEKVADYGKKTIPDVTGVSPNILVPAIVVAGLLLLILTAPRRRKPRIYIGAMPKAPLPVADTDAQPSPPDAPQRPDSVDLTRE